VSSLVVHCKKDAADVYIGRPSAWGNPWSLDTDGSRAEVIENFRAWIHRNPDLMRTARRTLAGKTLGCWCHPLACHGDVLAAIAPTIPVDDPVLVFGSNQMGINGKGAALFAQQYRGAVRGTGEGRQGSSYAIPTKSGDLKTLPIAVIRVSVARFLDYAREHSTVSFDVTRVGCGLAGYRDDQMAPLFFEAPVNCRLPHQWVRLRDPQAPVHIIIAGSRTIEDDQFPEEKVDALIANLATPPVIISGGAKGVDQRGERYAIDRGLHFERHPADWDRYGNRAGMIRNQFMSFRASHLIALWDGQSPGTAGMIRIALDDGLATRVLYPSITKKQETLL